MIRFMDFFYLKLFDTLFHFGMNESRAKHSAFLYLSAYLSLLIISIVSILGRTINCSLSQQMGHPSLAIWVMIFIVSPILLSLRYYRHFNIASIIESYNSIGSSKQKLITASYYAIAVAIPALTYILFF
jgi:hypothetical protein